MQIPAGVAKVVTALENLGVKPDQKVSDPNATFTNNVQNVANNENEIQRTQTANNDDHSVPPNLFSLLNQLKDKEKCGAIVNELVKDNLFLHCVKEGRQLANSPIGEKELQEIKSAIAKLMQSNAPKAKLKKELALINSQSQYFHAGFEKTQKDFVDQIQSDIRQTGYTKDCFVDSRLNQALSVNSSSLNSLKGEINHNTFSTAIENLKNALAAIPMALQEPNPQESVNRQKSGSGEPGSLSAAPANGKDSPPSSTGNTYNHCIFGGVNTTTFSLKPETFPPFLKSMLGISPPTETPTVTPTETPTINLSFGDIGNNNNSFNQDKNGSHLDASNSAETRHFNQSQSGLVTDQGNKDLTDLKKSQPDAMPADKSVDPLQVNGNDSDSGSRVNSDGQRQPLTNDTSATNQLKNGVSETGSDLDSNTFFEVAQDERNARIDSLYEKAPNNYNSDDSSASVDPVGSNDLSGHLSGSELDDAKTKDNLIQQNKIQTQQKKNQSQETENVLMNHIKAFFDKRNKNGSNDSNSDSDSKVTSDGQRQPLTNDPSATNQFKNDVFVTDSDRDSGSGSRVYNDGQRQPLTNDPSATNQFNNDVFVTNSDGDSGSGSRVNSNGQRQPLTNDPSATNHFNNDVFVTNSDGDSGLGSRVNSNGQRQPLTNDPSATNQFNNDVFVTNSDVDSGLGSRVNSNGQRQPLTNAPSATNQFNNDVFVTNSDVDSGLGSRVNSNGQSQPLTNARSGQTQGTRWVKEPGTNKWVRKDLNDFNPHSDSADQKGVILTKPNLPIFQEKVGKQDNQFLGMNVLQKLNSQAASHFWNKLQSK